MEKPNRDIKETFVTSMKVLGLVWETDRLLFIGNTVAVLIPAIMPFVVAYIFKLIIDVVVASFSGTTINWNSLYLYFFLLFVSSYINKFSFAFQDYTNRILITKLPINLYQKILGKISTLDLYYHENSNFKDLVQRVREIYAWHPLGLSESLFYFLQSLVQVIIALYAVVSLNPLLAVLILLVAFPDLFNQIKFSKLGWGVWSVYTPYRKRFMYLSELLLKSESLKELKVFLIGNKFLNETQKVLINFFRDNKKLLDKHLFVNSGLNLFDSVITSGVAIYIIFQAVLRKITIGDISFYQAVIQNYNNGISGIFRTLSSIFEHSLFVKSIFELLALEPKITEIENPIKVSASKAPRIEFKDVSFKYPDTENYVLKGFNLIIEPGEKVAFVGENGAGKTTLIKLLCRFYDVDSGEILINGINIKNLKLESWYKALGVLFQDFLKYEYTVKENIHFGKVWEELDLNKIKQASDLAGATSMVNKLDKGFDQMLGKTFEGGVELSVGQWQKVALSRAFFRNSPVLILDEPTSSIDAKAESEIFSRVERLSRNKTVVIISHRFSTVRNADKIYVIDKGRIVEEGSHEQLLKLDGEYATLFRLQAKGYQ